MQASKRSGAWVVAEIHLLDRPIPSPELSPVLSPEDIQEAATVIAMRPAADLHHTLEGRGAVAGLSHLRREQADAAR